MSLVSVVYVKKEAWLKYLCKYGIYECAHVFVTFIFTVINAVRFASRVQSNIFKYIIIMTFWEKEYFVDIVHIYFCCQITEKDISNFFFIIKVGFFG